MLSQNPKAGMADMGLQCPENKQGYYADDEYSELKNDDKNLSKRLMRAVVAAKRIPFAG